MRLQGTEAVSWRGVGGRKEDPRHHAEGDVTNRCSCPLGGRLGWCMRI